MTLARARPTAADLPQRKYGLQSPKVVQWLLAREPEVYAAVAAFIEGRLGTNKIDVAGPPSLADVQRYRANRHAPVGCPTIRLNLAMIMAADQLAVRITLSDADLDELMKWPLRRSIRSNYLEGQPRIEH
jgi:hypothetical protein